MKVIGIDPGHTGAVVVFDGSKFASYSMPVTSNGKEKEISFQNLYRLLRGLKEQRRIDHVFLERPVSFGMGTKGAFSYGRGYEAILISLWLAKLPYTLVEPGKWTKEMHAGISADLKAKVKSLIAVERLYPQLVGQLPRKAKGGVHDGTVDALLIAGYGLRAMGVQSKPVDPDDFF